MEGWLETADGRAVLRGDGMMTNVPGVMLGVQVADCVPVLVADVRRRAVAAFHAGWRGTLKRIVERGIGTLRLRYGSRPEDLVAVVGPAIGACCYAVGEAVRHEFESQFAYAEELFSEVYDSDPVREKYPLEHRAADPSGPVGGEPAAIAGCGSEGETDCGGGRVHGVRAGEGGRVEVLLASRGERVCGQDDGGGGRGGMNQATGYPHARCQLDAATTEDERAKCDTVMPGNRRANCDLLLRC